MRQKQCSCTGWSVQHDQLHGWQWQLGEVEFGCVGVIRKIKPMYNAYSGSCASAMRVYREGQKTNVFEIT